MKPDPIDAFDSTANPHLGAVISLPEFIGLAGELSTAERRTIVEQALFLIEDIYVHLPLKRAMHAVDPAQQLKLLRRKLDRLTERQFHNEMINIFKRLRDLHTNYILPAPYQQHTAFLPFLMEEFYDSDGRRHYIVTRIFQDFDHPTFGPGVEVTHWSGVPIDRAVEINADREAGSNEAARHVRGLDNMTVRPMLMSLPPDAEWEVVGYRTDDSDLEIRLPWQVFRPDPGPEADAMTGSGSTDLVMASLGLDLELEMTNRARKILFAPDVLDRQKRAADLRAQGDALDVELEMFQADNSLFPDTFQFRAVETDHGTFGYLRIRTFSAPAPDEFLAEVIRILRLLPQNGLIIDVRNNGGGIILNGERMLQLFAPGPVEAERLHFINTEVTAAIARSDALGGFARRWLPSIELAVVTGAVYSQGFPLEPPDATNALGRQYHGPVVLITDARCYSTTDFFAAGFQDNGLGKVLGVDDNTGAGGANVFTHTLLQTVLDGHDSPIRPLPRGADMRVALRMSARVKDRAGLPLEDLGVEPDTTHRLTRRDLLDGNRDLINEAGRILAGGAVRPGERLMTGAGARVGDSAPSSRDAGEVFPGTGDLFRRVADPRRPPFASICSIHVRNRNGRVVRKGTGWVVAPGMIATAAHLVDRAASVVVRPGWSGEAPPALGMSGGRIVVRPGFTSETATPDEDLAVVLLEGALDAAAAPLPLQVIGATTAGQTAQIVGYPIRDGRDRAIPGTELFEASGPVTVEDSFRLRYRIPTQAGQSGAPILMALSGRTSVVGLHLSGRDAIAPDSNRGMLLRQDLVDWVMNLST